ncbi:hypothetical protein NBRC116584_16890 [Hydrogenophaga sp. 5NK40-0174]
MALEVDMRWLMTPNFDGERQLQAGEARRRPTARPTGWASSKPWQPRVERDTCSECDKSYKAYNDESAKNGRACRKGPQSGGQPVRCIRAPMCGDGKTKDWDRPAERRYAREQKPQASDRRRGKKTIVLCRRKDTHYQGGTRQLDAHKSSAKAVVGRADRWGCGLEPAQPAWPCFKPL